ncbi:MAG TPA: AAA family ATPase [Actinomycetota bacterium]|jgi:class 3 adenylate cyclase/tetratricopeptide (TPR) repeat protein|nr:AAA family ATPase [Actinomycetota bacterium]
MSGRHTFVLTDVEHSTALWEHAPDEMSAAISRYRAIVADAVASQGGRLLRDRGEGEATFSVYSSEIAGVEAAAAMGRTLETEPWPSGSRIRARIAVFTGDAEERSGDFYGSSVNRGARVRSLAFGGQVLLAESTAAAVVDALDPDLALVDLGPRELQDLTEPEHVYELRWAGQSSEPEPLSDDDCSNHRWLERSASGDFVGRERELALLARGWSEASGGRRVLALVAGEPGIGKTALVARAASAVRDAGGLVLAGRWDEEVLAPYQGFREALSAYAAACPRSILRADLRDHAAHLGRLFPEIASRVELEADYGDSERLRLFEAIDAWLEMMAWRHPVMLVLEDVHWADRPSALLLQHLLRGPRPSALFIVATYRDTDIEETDFGHTLPVLYRDRGTLRVPLAGLDSDEVAELLARVASSEPAGRADRLAGELHAETGGNPFFLQEIVRHLTETGRLEQPSDERKGRIDLPDSVRDIVRRRLSRLSGDLGESLAVASVVGQEFDFQVLNLATDIDEGRLLDALDEACRAGLTHEHDADRYAFSHAVVRRTLLDDLSATRRLRLHRRVAEALEQHAPEATAAELAHHFSAAASLGLGGKAVEYSRAAGDRAMAELAYEAAVLQYLRALDVHDAHGDHDGGVRCELTLALGNAYDKAGEYYARDEQFKAAADIARELDRTDLFVAAALGYGGVLPAAVEPDEQGHALLREALERLGPQANRERALVLGRLAHWMHFVPPRSARRSMADEAVAIARRLGDPDVLADALSNRCWAMDGPDDLEDQLEIADEVLAIGSDTNKKTVLLEGLRLRTDALFEKGDIDALRDAVSELSRLAEELRVLEYIRIAWAWDAVFATFEGRYEDAELIKDKVHEMLRSMGHSQSELVSAALSFPMNWMRGKLIEGLPLYEALAEAMPSRLFYSAVAAWCTADAGMHERTREILDAVSPDAISSLAQGYVWWSTLVGFTQAVTQLGDREWAETLYALMAPYSGRLCTTGSSGFLGAVDHYLGELALIRDDPESAGAYLEAALEQHGRMHARPFVALTQMAYARLLLDRGDPATLDRAHELQDAAIATALELGLKAVQGRASIRSPGA